jgi:hypothetical protein
MIYRDGNCSVCNVLLQISSYCGKVDGYLCASCTRYAYANPHMSECKRNFDAAIAYHSPSRLADTVEKIKSDWCDQCKELHQ